MSPLRRRGAGTPRRSSATTSSSSSAGSTATFRADTVVFDAAREAWFRPRGAAVGGPGPRAFHCAVAIGGPVRHVRANRPHPARRRVGARHGDVVVGGSRAHQAPPARLLLRLLLRRLLLLPLGADSRDSPAPRDFGTAAVVPGTSEILLFGGYDGRRWLARRVDAGRRRRPMARPRRPARPAPEVGTRHDRRRDAPRRFRGTSRRRRALRRPVGAQGRRRSRRRDNEQHRRPRRSRSARGKRRSRRHSRSRRRRRRRRRALPGRAAPVSDERVTVGPAVDARGLGGASPCARTGHTLTAGASSSAALIVFGGHGDDGWLVSRRSYYDDVHCVDGAAGRWRRVSVGRDPSTAQRPRRGAFHTLTNVGRDRALLFGGFTGETALGDAWWLNLKPSESEERFDDDVGTLGGAPGGGGLFASPVGAAAGLLRGPRRPRRGRRTAGERRRRRWGFRGVRWVRRSRGGSRRGRPGVFARGVFAASSNRDAPARSPRARRRRVRVRRRILPRAARGGDPRRVGGPDAALERLAASLEGPPSTPNEFAAEAMGEDGAREFLASCDAEDLRVGDARKALEEYRAGRAEPSGAGAGGTTWRRPLRPRGGRSGRPGGGSCIVAPEALRVGDVPAMLAELQGARIAEAHEERSRHAGETTDE